MSNPAADLFDKWARDGRDAGMEEGHSDVVNQVVETMNIRPGDQILALGCGNGWATRLPAQQAAATLLVDDGPALAHLRPASPRARGQLHRRCRVSRKKKGVSGAKDPQEEKNPIKPI